MTFRFIFPQPLGFAVWLRVIFAGLGLLYATAWLNGETLYTRGWTESPVGPASVADLNLAARWFPLDFHYQMGAAKFLSFNRFPGSRALAIEALRKTLDVNPFASDMRRNYASVLYEDGQIEAAKQQLLIFHALVPNAPLYLFVDTNPANR